jgi:hypothetical protein
MFRRATFPYVIGITVAALLQSMASATTIAPLDLKALSARADRVVVGTVERTGSAWTADHSAIYTETTIKVDHSVKGGARPGERVVVRHEGGSVDGIGMRVYGAAAFTVGEEVLLFLEHRGQDSYVVGMAQGKLSVRTIDGGRRLVTGSYEGLAFTDGARHQPIHGRPLEDLEREVRSYEVRRSGP